MSLRELLKRDFNKPIKCEQVFTDKMLYNDVLNAIQHQNSEGRTNLYFHVKPEYYNFINIIIDKLKEEDIFTVDCKDCELGLLFIEWSDSYSALYEKYKKEQELANTWQYKLKEILKPLFICIVLTLIVAFI